MNYQLCYLGHNKIFLNNYAFIPGFVVQIRDYEDMLSWKCRLSLSECQKLISQGAVQVLPKSDPGTGHKLVWLRPARWAPSVHDSDMFMRAGALSADALSLEDHTQEAGIVVLFDLAEFGLAQLRALTPAIAKKLVHLLAVGNNNKHYLGSTTA